MYRTEAAPASGWYRYARPERTGEWDGVTWTARTRPDPTATATQWRRVVGDPRVGVLLALGSGAGFGWLEAIGYTFSASGANSTVVLAWIRPVTELPHATWTATAAVLIWLGAYRRRRLLTWIGLIGWLVAAVSHSLHDGILAVLGHPAGTHNTARHIELSSTGWVVAAVVLMSSAMLAFFVVSVWVLHFFLREVVPPDAVADSPPRWHPRLHPWGCHSPTEAPSASRPASQHGHRNRAVAPLAGRDGRLARVTTSESSLLDEDVAALLKRTAAGLVPAIVQDATSGQVLMLAWMNDEALHLSLTTGRGTYWSRSRKKLWTKGEESGHTQSVREIRLDCDGDTLLVRVDQVGPACHTGATSCFDVHTLLAEQPAQEDR